MRNFFHKYENVWVAAFLILSILLVYGQVQTHDFVHYDDYGYIVDNPHVSDGLTVDSIVWAFTSTSTGNWHPLTWISHMLDCQLFGLNAGYHHLTNLILHMANSLLLFFMLKSMTGALWRAAFVAALFALHPLHVESVAWVAERKDVLSALFWMLTIWAYARWVKHRGAKRYVVVVLLFSAGLLAKPMVVTLPFVLLLLDYWPLGRFDEDRSSSGGAAQGVRVMLKLAGEKTPFFMLAAVSCALTVLAQGQGGAIAKLAEYPVTFRFANALTSYAGYLAKMIWPVKLAVFYPLPDGLAISWGKVAGAGLVLAAVTFLAIRWIRRRPYFAVGWFWYVGTLVPVIGLVQVGAQSMADRYSYIPLIGVFIMIAWALAELAARCRRTKQWLTVAAAVTLVVLSVLSWKQVGYWKNTMSLFEHVIDVTPDNLRVYTYLGRTLYTEKQYNDAIPYYRQALRIYPGYGQGYYHLGNALARLGRIDEALAQYRQALLIGPGDVKVHNSLGLALIEKGRISKAIAHFSQALRLDPENASAENNLGNALGKLGRIDEAIIHYNEALRKDPSFFRAQNNLGLALIKKGRNKEAITVFSQAARKNPDYIDAHFNLALALLKQGRFDQALDSFRQTLRIEPDDENDHHYHEKAYNFMGIIFFSQGDLSAAEVNFRAALRINPAYRNAADNLNRVRALMKQREKTSGAK